MDSLKATIQSAWTKLNEEVVRRSCASVEVRLRLMIKAKGGAFEIWPVHYVFSIHQKSCVETFTHLPSVIIFLEFFGEQIFLDHPANNLKVNTSKRKCISYPYRKKIIFFGHQYRLKLYLWNE